MDLTIDQRSAIERIANAYGLSLVLGFGSRARGTAHAGSDTDIAVLAADRLGIEAIDAIARELRAVFMSDVDVVDAAAAPPLLAGRIARDAVLLSGDPAAFAHLRMRLLARYFDFQPHLARRSERLRREFRPRSAPV